MQPDKLLLLNQGEAAALLTAESIVREALAERDSRGEDYAKNWDMFQNKHEDYFKKRLNEPTNIFNYRKKNAIKSNLCGFVVELGAKYLYGKASKVIRRFSKRPETEKRMREITKLFELESFLLDAAKKTACYGELLIRNVPVDAITKEQISNLTTETTYPHPILTEPTKTFVKTNRYGRLVGVVIQYAVKDYATGNTKSVTELVVDDSRWVWESDSTVSFEFGRKWLSTASTGIAGGKLVKAEANSYPITSEFVFFVNNKDRKSDLKDILDLNIALDEALTDKQHFFQKHGWPQLVSEVSLKNVEFNPNFIWEITPDVDDKKKVKDRIDFLTWDGKMEDHAKFVKNLERNIMIISNTAAISTGDLEAIGQLRSGAALITAHSCAIHKTEAKQIVWNENERALYRALASMDSLFHNEKVGGRFSELDPFIQFPKDFVPGAEAERVNIQQIQAISHLKPVRDIIREQYGDLTDEEVEQKYQEILKDAKELVDSLRKFETEEKPAEGGVSGKSGTSQEKSKEQTKTTE